MLSKNLRIHAVLILACIFMILFPLYSEKPDSEKTDHAVAVAQEFLELVDSGAYAVSWQSSASLMKSKVTEQEWTEKLTQARSLSGMLIERTQKSASYSTEAKDSPDGEYIMLIYDSRFQKAEEVAEYVTVMLDGDQWKVAGYFMQ